MSRVDIILILDIGDFQNKEEGETDSDKKTFWNVQSKKIEKPGKMQLVKIFLKEESIWDKKRFFTYPNYVFGLIKGIF